MNQKTAIDKLYNSLRQRHYAKSTVKTYTAWVRQFCCSLAKMPPEWSSEQKVEAFLSKMARSDYSASSQNQAFNSILYFYKHILDKPLQNIDALRAKKHQRIREAAHPEDTQRFLAAISEVSGYPMRLLAHLYYECGLRLSEATQIRLKDIEMRTQHITIRNGKGGKDRVVSLPCSLVYPIQRQIAKARCVWEQDRRNDLPVPLPGRLAKKYPSSPFQESWAWLFPAHKPCEYPKNSDKWYRWHVHESTVSRALRNAAKKVGLQGRISAHVLRHSYATDLLNQGGNVRMIQKSMGHKHLDTTMGYLHVPEGERLWSPMEAAHA